MNALLNSVLWIVRRLISLRYRLEIIGLEKIVAHRFEKSGGILFLPNHPAELDPIFLELVLSKQFRPRPLIVEHFYHLKGFKWFMDLVQALPLPTMDTAASSWRGKKIQKQFQTVVNHIKAGDNFLIYPSGRLKQTGYELLGGASFVHDLLQRAPEVNVVLVRTTGLWGSMFSRAITGASPNFGKTLMHGIRIILKNGIFFVPRRKVKIEFELPTADFPYRGTRLELNKYLEKWYNRYPAVGAEPLTLVSYAVWKEELPLPANLTTDLKTPTEQRPVSPAIQKEIFKELSTLSGQPLDKIERSMHLSHDLGLDSLDIAGLHIFIDEHYGIKNILPGEIRTVEELLQAAAGYLQEREVVATVSARSWPKDSKRYTPKVASLRTIQEAFFLSCERSPSAIACTDALTGPLTYRKLKMVVLILSDQMRRLPGQHIGVLLPATVGTYLVILAILCARKIPVMLNWTAGVRSLDHSTQLAQVEAVISSDRFLDRLENGDLGIVEDKLVLMEELRKKITWKNKGKGLLLSWASPKYLLRKLSLNTLQSTDMAAILFTSGTETLPKGVPLTHENLLADQQACLDVAKLRAEDTLYGVLPPFHSFGFSITGLLPLLSGVKVCYAPDPNDSHGMVHDVFGWKATLLFSAPSFIKALLRVAKPTELASLRLVASGAEKAPQELFDYFEQHLPQAKLIEGYGITECGPVVTLDRPEETHRGVGKPLPGITLKIINPDTLELVPQGQEGEVCIAGPNVFSGYLGVTKDPFLRIEGKQFYRSGDRGYMDPDGTLIISGRMKRFVKIGGEMVSLTGLEDELLRIAHLQKWLKGDEEGPPLAVGVKENDTDKPTIILFTTFPISKEDVNNALKECGFGRIVKIAEVREMEQIPLTGTGKTHYRVLDELLTK